MRKIFCRVLIKLLAREVALSCQHIFLNLTLLYGGSFN